MAILRLVLILSLAAAAADREPAPPRYSIESLGGGRVQALNDSGGIIGSDGAPGRPRAFVQVRGRRQYVEGLGEFGGHAAAVNAAGVVAGTAWEAATQPFGFAWRDGVTTRLPVPDGMRSASAFDLNGRGDFVGHGRLGERQVALAWSGDSVRILPALIDGGSASARAINDSGWIAGNAMGAGNRYRPVLWRGGAPVDLGAPADAIAIPVDVNEHGQVVGSLNTGIATARAFLWENGEMTDLAPGTYAEAAAINDSGQVVGRAAPGSDTTRPVLWEGGRMVYLDELLPRGHGWSLLHVTDINNQGWIIGMGRSPEGLTEAWLMKPVR